ncbi:hypothetical protein HPB52_004388 [Rhipicephalus sanguineus]|uniref:cyclin-dependent kinase n=1 Tax=Rhipicephalus sanguineus TaxID=34632 RepID=A0A9D4QGC0_RHISA|nr:hypothetical protein HPB52_004388 [Rhipicephalus sanguineus]
MTKSKLLYKASLNLHPRNLKNVAVTRVTMNGFEKSESVEDGALDNARSSTPNSNVAGREPNGNLSPVCEDKLHSEPPAPLPPPRTSSSHSYLNKVCKMAARSEASSGRSGGHWPRPAPHSSSFDECTSMEYQQMATARKPARPKSEIFFSQEKGSKAHRCPSMTFEGNMTFGRIEAYVRLEQLGEGSYATVYRGYSNLMGKVVALKEIRLQPEEGTPFTAIREASLLRGLKHANIVTLHDIIHTKDTLTFVFEYVHTDLSQYLEKHPGGLNPKNVKVVPTFWGVGCIFIEMITGAAAFPGVKDTTDQLDKIWRILGTPTEETWEGVSRYKNYKLHKFGMYPGQPLKQAFPKLSEIPQADEIANRFLQLQPHNRISAVDAMRHSYFADMPPKVYDLPDLFED